MFLILKVDGLSLSGEISPLSNKMNSPSENIDQVEVSILLK